jgi:spermidine/putrescine transport system substrate-binding protein
MADQSDWTSHDPDSAELRALPRSPRSQALARGLSRRSVLQNAALAAVATPSLAAFLAACSKAGGALPGSAPTTLKIASPQTPITWPLSTDNPAVADGAAPEMNATLRLYNYADYIDPNAIKSFEKKYAQYKVKVTVSTFNTTDEALTKIRAGDVPYDMYFPSYDQISKMVTAKLIRPLTHSLIPNITNVWEAFQNPWYDGSWRYTVPYTVYTTGIGWRTDQVKDDVAGMTNPYEVFWDSKYKGKIAVIDDWHTAMALALLRQGITNINTTDAKQIASIGTQLTEMFNSDKPKVTITMYNDLPAGQLGICQMWSGDVVNALSYLPKGTSPNVLRYWFPSDGKGMVDNDLMVCLAGGKNPVMAQMFMNHMLDSKTAAGNFSYIGYQPPQRNIVPEKLVSDGFLPSNLASATVLESYFNVGYRLLELPPAADLAWHQIWQTFKAGG